MATVDIQGVRKSFGDAEVVHGVDIAIGEGEFVVLVGPSGCGKSTLLRMIAGLEEVTGGVIRIDGEVVNHLPPKDRDIAMVFQNYALYPQMTVRKNMAFGLMLRKESKAEIEKRVNNAAEILDLTELLERYPRQLSGGQRQRVAMGRAIVRDPRVFLFDEPLSNLDAKLRVQMRTEIRALQKRLRTTSVYVTHDQVEAMTMADRIVVMHRGKIEQIDSPLDLYDRPSNMFVAGFIGSPAMNFISGVIQANGGGKTLCTSEGVTLALPADCAGDVGREIVFGVRPEHLTICAENDAAAMPAQLRHIEPTGSQTFVFAEVAGNAQICLISNDPRSLKVGAIVRLKPNPASIYLFDKQSGQVIR